MMAAVLVVVLGGSSAARAASTTAHTSDEAWYRPSPCAADVACSTTADTPSPYPAHTLHVSVTAGQESARTYLTLDLSSMDRDAVLTGGTLVLPLAGPDSGSFSPEDAQLRACATSGDVGDADGSSAAMPEVSCGVSSTATFVAATADERARFEIDLERFVDAWKDGSSASVAIMPTVASLTPATTWSVAFDGKDRDAEDVQPITARLLFEEGDKVPAAADMPAITPTAPTRATGDATTFSMPRLDTPQPAVTRIEPSTSATADARSLVPVVALDGGFAYPAVFLLPLGLLGLCAYLGWALTRPIRSGDA
jgi:hypothetical protein